MRSSRFQSLLVGLLAFVLAGVFFFAVTAFAAEEEEDGGTYTGIPKDRSCTWWLDESKEVSKEDRAEIKKLFEALEKKLEKDGLDSVEYPWKPPEDEEEKEAEEKKEEKELTDEQKKWEEDEWFEDPETCPGVIIPSKDDINVAKVDGIATGTLFVVRGKFEDPRIEVWRMKLAKEDDEWSVVGREIEQSFEPVYFLHVRENTAFNFKTLNIDHDRMHISAEDGRFYPLYAGNDTIIGGTVFGGEARMNFTPPRRLAKDWETDQELVQVRLRTQEFLGKGQGVEEFKNAEVTMFTFYFTPSNFKQFVQIDGLESFPVDDKKEFKEAKKRAEGEIDWLAATNWAAKLPNKGQPEGEKKLLKLYYLHDYDGLCDMYIKTPKYHWIGYYEYPLTAYSGYQEEIYVYANRDVALMAGDRGKGVTLCRYNRADQRESLTRREAEYEPVADGDELDRKVDVNIGFKEITLQTETSLSETGLVLGSTAIFAKFRTTMELEVLKSGVRVLPFQLWMMSTPDGPSTKVMKILDDRGLDVLGFDTTGTAARLTLIFPVLAAGQRLTFTTEYEGAPCARMHSTSSYGSAASRWIPEYGYLDCGTIEIVLGVPKPNVGVTVGGLIEKWEDKGQNFSHWASDECIRMAVICYSDFNVIEATFPKPNGQDLKFYYFYHNKLGYTVSEADVTDFEDRHTGGGAWGGQGRRTEEDWRAAAKFHKLDYQMRSPQSVVDEFESILKFHQNIYVSYPYKKIAAVMMPILTFLGQGFPTLLTLDGTSFVSEGDRAAYDWLFKYMYGWGPEFWAHEHGHQYWGHVVGWRTWRDQWFSETFTEFQSSMYMQATRGDEPYKRKYQEWYGHALECYKNGPLAMPQNRMGPGGGRRGMYSKGPCLMHMLRRNIGDKAYIAYCRNLVKSLYWKNPTTCDFLEVLEQTLGKENIKALYGKEDMRWWFDQWIYGMGIPSYEYGYKISGNTAKIKIKHLADKKVGEHAAENFRVRIPMWVYPESGEKYAIPLLLRGEKLIEEFEVKLRGPAKELILNEFDTVLVRKIKKVKYKKIK